jgi:prepilin-type N-terminal cleavage/methylation domain-containing protein
MRTRRAFTLVELLIVVLIIGALAAVAIPRMGASATASKADVCKTNVNMINRQIELYVAHTGDYPNNWNQFKNDTDYIPDGPPECPFGDEYSIHGSLKRVQPHNH